MFSLISIIKILILYNHHLIKSNSINRNKTILSLSLESCYACEISSMTRIKKYNVSIIKYMVDSNWKNLIKDHSAIVFWLINV